MAGLLALPVGDIAGTALGSGGGGQRFYEAGLSDHGSMGWGDRCAGGVQVG
jgi:hypothetical protein